MESRKCCKTVLRSLRSDAWWSGSRKAFRKRCLQQSRAFKGWLVLMDLKRVFHMNGLKRYFYTFLINHVYVGAKHFEKKRKLMNGLGHSVDEGTKIVGPVDCTGTLKIGKNCWIGKRLSVHGNGIVTIGDCCDIAPEVTFVTGTHHIGDAKRRAGEGMIKDITVGNGTWIGARATVFNDIGDSCVIGACSFVNHPIENNSLAFGVPAKKSKDLI